MNYWLPIHLLAILTCLSCGGSGSTSGNVPPEKPSEVPSEKPSDVPAGNPVEKNKRKVFSLTALSPDQLPDCTRDIQGALALVRDTNSFYSCAEDRWSLVEFEPAKGPKGDSGAPGSPGLDGKDGTNGADGANGANGANGADGANGPKGSDGRDFNEPIIKVVCPKTPVTSIPDVGGLPGVQNASIDYTSYIFATGARVHIVNTYYNAAIVDYVVSNQTSNTAATFCRSDSPPICFQTSDFTTANFALYFTSVSSNILYLDIRNGSNTTVSTISIQCTTSYIGPTP